MSDDTINIEKAPGLKWQQLCDIGLSRTSEIHPQDEIESLGPVPPVGPFAEEVGAGIERLRLFGICAHYQLLRSHRHCHHLRNWLIPGRWCYRCPAGE